MKGKTAVDESHDIEKNARAFRSAKDVMTTYTTIVQSRRDKETREPCAAISCKHGSEEGWEKRQQ